MLSIDGVLFRVISTFLSVLNGITGPHFVAFSQAVLYRGADLAIVWPLLVAMAVIGSVYFAFALLRFRRVIFGT